MKQKLLLTALLLFILGMFFTVNGQSDDRAPLSADADSSVATASDTSKVAERVIAYYFHGEHRCATCMKLESYSEEALSTSFEKELEDSSLIWLTVNYDEEKNKHFIKDYQLFTKALILSRVRNGKEVEWRNLDKIWELVGDKEEYLKYVQTETRAFLTPESEQD